MDVFCLVIYFYAAGCGLPVVLHKIFFSHGTESTDDLILAGSIALSLFLSLVMLILLRKLVNYFHRKFNVEKLKRNKYKTLIGLGGVALSSFIPRIVVFFYAGNDWVMIYTVYLSFGSMLFFFLIFQLPRISTYKVDYSIDETMRWIAYSIRFHIILLIITIILGYFICPNKTEFVTVQVTYSVYFGFSSFEFVQVWRGGFKLNSDENVIVRYYHNPRNVRISGYSEDMGTDVIFARFVAASAADYSGGYS